LIGDFKGLTDEQVVEKLENAPAGTYLSQIYSDLYSVSPLSVEPKTPLAVLEKINDQERTKLRFDFQAFVQKVLTDPLATFTDNELTLLTNKLVENQTYAVRKNINSALVKLASDNIYQGIKPLFKNTRGSGKELLTVSPDQATALSAVMTELSRKGYTGLTTEETTKFIHGLYQIGVIPSLFVDEQSAQEYLQDLHSNDPEQFDKLVTKLKTLSNALVNVAANTEFANKAQTIFGSQTKQSASEDNVPYLKLAANAYDEVIDFVLV